MALRSKEAEVGTLRVLTLLLHDERFSGWTIQDKLARQHFSLQYLRFCTEKGWEPTLYTFHQQVRSKQTYRLNGAGTVKIFPVDFRFPPLQRFGNDHNPKSIMQEALAEQPDLVHFHNYYLHSFPYTAVFVKKKLMRPLTVQLHGYNNSSLRKWFSLPCLLALRRADCIVYSYKPEEALYRKIGVMEKAVRIPVPGIDPQVFLPQRRCESNRLLYVGRIPNPERAYGEKSPFLLLLLMRRLLRQTKDVVLDVIGDGPGLDHCRRVALRLGLREHVVFHGHRPYGELPKYYQTSALTFSPIRVYDVDGWFDGAIQESLACGTPVASLRASAKTPLHGTYGVLLSNSTERAAEEVASLLKERGEMDEAAEAGSRFVRKNCSHSTVRGGLQEVWEGAMRA